MTEEPEEELYILQALARIGDVKDFRLREFMEQVGLDPNQTVSFYRRLISEARKLAELIDIFEQNIDVSDKAIKKLKAELAAAEQLDRTQRVKLRTMQDRIRQKSESLDKERHGLLATTSELQDKISKLQDKVWRYDTLVQLLSGEIKPHTLKAMSEMFWDMHTDALNAVIDGTPLPDPAVLEKNRQKLMQMLRDILRVPPEEWKKKLEALDAKNEQLQKDNQALAIVNWVEYQQALKGKPPDENKELQESDEAPTWDNVYESQQALWRETHNETTDEGG